MGPPLLPLHENCRARAAVKPLAVAAAALFSLRMGRPRKAAKASRANGAQAQNKGKAVDVKDECFGGYSPGGTYVVSTTKVRRQMAKGEVRRCELGCEKDVFTFCLYHGKCLDFDEGSARKDRRSKDGVDLERWDAAKEEAVKLLKRVADKPQRTKLATLRKLARGAEVPIKFEAA